jgi:hypothetical protein
LAKGIIANPITGEDTVHSNTMVEVISRDGRSDVIHVIERVLACDREDFSPCETLPVEVDRVEEVCEVLAELAEEFYGIGGDED